VKRKILNNLKTGSGDDSHEKPFLDHLEDLRMTIIKVIVSLVVVTIICFFFSAKILEVLKLPFLKLLNSGRFSTHGTQPLLVSLKPAGAFIVSIKISLLSGIILSLPVNLYFLANFLMPALKERERKYILAALLTVTHFFIMGIAFSFFAAIPVGLKFLWAFHLRMDIVPAWTIEYYISFVLISLLAFGIVFEVPVAILILARLGIVKHNQLKDSRKYIIITVLFLAAILTPPDPVTQLMLALPLIIHYEMCIWMAKFIRTKTDILK
jgi:sec-independent protein translocase protein TatC